MKEIIISIDCHVDFDFRMIDICVRMLAHAEQGSSISDFPILLTMGAVENLVYLPMVNWSNK